MLEVQRIEFAYPAYVLPSNRAASIELYAQLLGDADALSTEQRLLFTMDGKSLTRKRTRFHKIQSVWNFRAVCDIERVRTFFADAEGEYIYYKHYDGSEWIIIPNGSTYSISSSGVRASFINAQGQRTEAMTHDFQLTVDRWAYA